MALRLSGVASAPTSTTSTTAADSAAAPAQLAARATALLAAADLRGYHALSAELREIADEQRRFQGSLLVLERGLAAANAAGNAVAKRTYVAVCELALALLETAPAEPQLLNVAGVACYELWCLDAAQTLFAAAQRLDHAHPEAARNLEHVARRRRGPRPSRPLHPGAAGLSRRAEQIAAGARPTAGQTLSLCMIVRDEEERLGACLAAVAPAVDEMIVVDTGSVDRTVQIAREHGARVIEREWTGSFADARNASLDAATGDWTLYLDADEVLASDDVARLRELLGRTWHEAFYLVETSFTGELGDGTAITHNALRLIRNRPEYRFEGRVHEQILHALPTWAPGRIAYSPVRIEHYGYLGAVRATKEKFTRNAELLRRHAAEHGADAFMHHNLGWEYTGTGDHARAADEFAAAWRMLEADGQIARSAFAAPTLLGLVKTLRGAGRREQSTTYARTGLEHFPRFTDLVYEQAITATASGDRETARTLYERCLTMGDAPADHGGMLGTGSYWPRTALAVMALDDGEPDRARELLDWCLTHHPAFHGALGPYATACRRLGIDGDTIVSELERRVELTHRARQAIAAALLREGAAGAAEPLLRTVQENATTDDLRADAGSALGELLLARGDLAGAARVTAGIAPGAPRAALACRIETTARLALDDLPGAEQALAGAVAAGLPEAEREAFAAWLSLARGDGAPAVPVAGVPLLATLMEILSRTGAHATVAQLRTLIEGSRLPERDRRQLLAEIALSAGDLAAAAAEWMAVCATAPDAPALVGLAEIAARQGLRDDVAVFASAALELAPEDARARTLLDGAAALAGALDG